jgi:SAM-dependent methyltransferase
MSIDPESFPRAFDPAVYRALHSDLWYYPDDALRAHYERSGRAEGRRPHTLPERGELLRIIADARSILEIGPGGQPLLTGKQVRYFDVVDHGQQTREAGDLDAPWASAPAVHYVSPTGDLSIVDRTFEVIISSHAIEHQPDLTGHLRQVEDLLEPGGLYVILAPDKRFCFDHFMPESTIGDVMEAALERRTLHSARAIVHQNTLRTHNDPVRHWAGDHGEPENLRGEPVESAITAYVDSVSKNRYLDRHAWQFTPGSFETIVRLLNEIGLISLPAHRVYSTLSGHHEFWAVLGPKPASTTVIPAAAGADVAEPALEDAPAEFLPDPAAAAPAAASQRPATLPATPAAADTWGVDSVQPQPNMLVVRGWSTPAPVAARLQVPENPPVHGEVRACVRRETWGPADPQEREAGFIAVFTLEHDLQIDQFLEATLVLQRPDGQIEMPLIAAGEWRKQATIDAHNLLRQWMDTIVEESRVIEIGARSRTSASIRDNLKGSFTGVDIVPGSGVDILADAHLLTDAITDQTFTHAFSTSTFEHLFCPIQAVSELNEVLEVGALAFIHCHQSWGYHEAPWDFFRFSDSAWHALFNEVTGFEIIATRMADEAIIVPVTEWGNASVNRQADHGKAYATSVVLARKIGPSRVARIYSSEDLARVYPGFYPD